MPSHSKIKKTGHHVSLADTGVQKKSRRLENRNLALAVCGGIAAVESVKILRELRRYGAKITPFFTPHVIDFITELSVEWAAGEKVVTKMGADVDHLDPFDLVIVAPVTLNTLSKSALGLADNPVTLLIAGQLGRKSPLLFVPTMNTQLLGHPLYLEYVTRLKGWGAEFLESEEEEGRVKMAPPERLVKRVIEVLS